VVDTNVWLVANGGDTHATPGCVERCADRLAGARNSDRVVLDNGGRIKQEYLRHLRRHGTPRGLGDLFVVWLFTNEWNPKHCTHVPITQIGTDPDDFAEFPDDPELAKFDRSDRKFVAVALASPEPTTILNASDTRSWWRYREPLLRHGLHIEFVCPELMRVGHRRRIN
jgi:hypothetical protein